MAQRKRRLIVYAQPRDATTKPRKEEFVANTRQSQVREFDQTKPFFLVVDIGTFCDYVLMDTIRKDLLTKYNVINLSSAKGCSQCIAEQ